MNSCPPMIAGARVICFTGIDQRHRFTGNCKHGIGNQVIGQMDGLAICQYEGEKEFYLFGCDAGWQCVTDTLHPTLEDAKFQAEFEYEGVSKTWINAV